MANHYIHVGSITSAMRGRHLLEAQGIYAHVQRSVRPMENEGCGYRLLVTGDVQRAERMLRTGGVRVTQISDAL